jgi:RimJ/RimL family protein N-acetyltransferase
MGRALEVRTGAQGELADDVQLSYEISLEYWGQGYATEPAGAVLADAFGTLELDRLVAFARPENVNSVRVLGKLGFLPDGNCTDDAGNVCSFYFLPRERWTESF